MGAFRSATRIGIAALGLVMAMGTQTGAQATVVPAVDYLPVGPQTAVPVSTVTDGGWTQCYLDTYADNLEALLPGVLDACTGPYLMLAARPTGSDTLSLLAAAPREDVLFDTGTGNTTHDANGTAWYFNAHWSWGFANEGDAVQRGECDVASGPLRLCWHTVNSAGGYRIGDTYSFGTDYERLVYQAGGAVLAPQAITFTSLSPASPTPGTTYDVSATGGESGSPVTLSIDPASAGVCTINDSTVSFEHAGSCVIDADQAGADGYAAAPQAQQTVAVAKLAQAISFTSPIPDAADTVVGATYDVAATGGSSDNPVTLSVDEESAGSCTIDGGRVTFVHPGVCAVRANQAGDDDHAAAPTATLSIPVSQAATLTGVSVLPKQIVARVAIQSPGAGAPTGSVDFYVGGSIVGSAPVLEGAARLAHVVPAGSAREVAAAYSGDGDFLGSSESTTRRDPRVTAIVTSAKPKSGQGWYRTPVKVSFRCAPHGAPLTAACPSPVTLRASRAGQSVSRTVMATDGGIATASVSGIDVDRRTPRVRIAGVKAGRTYLGRAPKPRCVAQDSLSGISTCTLRRHVSGVSTRWTALATDAAGNQARTSVTYRVLPIYLQGATYRNGTFAVHAGQTYTLVVMGSASRPVYYDAAVFPRRPHQADTAFYAAGHHRWTLGITMGAGMRAHPLWNLGVKIGRTLHTVKIRVS